MIKFKQYLSLREVGEQNQVQGQQNQGQQNQGQQGGQVNAQALNAAKAQLMTAFEAQYRVNPAEALKWLNTLYTDKQNGLPADYARWYQDYQKNNQQQPQQQQPQGNQPQQVAQQPQVQR